jgi:glycosyltransferase involved in cell wall biosynthesis
MVWYRLKLVINYIASTSQLLIEYLIENKVFFIKQLTFCPRDLKGQFMQTSQDLLPSSAIQVDENPEVFMGRKIIVIIPAYNEERFIGSVILKLKKFPVEVIVVDDGSTDETASIAKMAGVVVFRQESNQGKGTALNTGLHAARESSPDVIVMLDADGQHLPEELPRIIKPILDGEADIVVGSRYINNTSNTPLIRRWGHRFINLATTLPSGVSVTDSQSGYRAFSRRAFELADFHSNGFSVESEMQFLAHEHHLKVLEVPITIRYTDKAKRSPFRQGMIVLGGIIKLTGQYRPLFYFGVPGLLILILGIGWGFIVVQRYEQTHVLATGYAMICLLLCIIGLIMLSTGFILHSVRGLLTDLLREHS